MATKHRAATQKKDKKRRSIIYFSFGAALEVEIGIQSTRNTFLVDVLEAWAIQQNNIIGAQPLITSEGVTHPDNPYMKAKISNINNKIKRKNKQIKSKKDKLKEVTVVSICPKEFSELLHIFAKLLPMRKEGFFHDADINSFSRNEQNLFKKIHKWKEEGRHDKPP